jgi:hypothetical protein
MKAKHLDPARKRSESFSKDLPEYVSILAKIVAEVSGRNPETIVREPGLGTEYSGDNTRLMAAMGGFRFTEMRESVGRLYAWYEAHKQEIDPALLRFDG